MYWENVALFHHELSGTPSDPRVPNSVCENASLFAGYPPIRMENWLLNKVKIDDFELGHKLSLLCSTQLTSLEWNVHDYLLRFSTIYARPGTNL